ncbi:MAG: hypothetical protein Hyperionvirus25_21 [Hyperionvirus sp.]|uniref:Uncharacterized protein n=1 Tax=Hyperionvirus sp. TaxID=2487770 RepID=A0A3G5AB13_9VIRU|nr:MAG: hypothetical protein Hyperionvirus25_21 [Hyperionvirus sp.]
MNKYSNRIIKFINNNFALPEIKPNKFFSDIINIVRDTGNKIDYVTDGSRKLFQIHEKNQYPLMFLLFCKLYETNALHQILDDDPDEKPLFSNKCDFVEFVYWYRKNQHRINFYKLELNQESNHELIQLYELVYKTNGSRKELHDLLYTNKFLSLDVQHHAESVDMTKTVYHGSRFRLSVHIPDDGGDPIDIKKIVHIIQFMNELGERNGSTKNPHIIIFAGLQRKQFPFDTEVKLLSSDNINSGASVMGEYIMIWREEEIYKVLIHELIHFHRIDAGDGYAGMSKYFMEKYNVRYVDKPNESYTEALAVIFHSAFVSYYNNIPMETILQYELMFTFLQIAKILLYFDITETNQLGSKQIIQTTSVFSYFIIKGALLADLENFITFIGSTLAIGDRVEEFMLCVQRSMNAPGFFFGN